MLLWIPKESLFNPLDNGHALLACIKPTRCLRCRRYCKKCYKPLRYGWFYSVSLPERHWRPGRLTQQKICQEKQLSVLGNISQKTISALFKTFSCYKVGQLMVWSGFTWGLKIRLVLLERSSAAFDSPCCAGNSRRKCWLQFPFNVW